MKKIKPNQRSIKLNYAGIIWKVVAANIKISVRMPMEKKNQNRSMEPIDRLRQMINYCQIIFIQRRVKFFERTQIQIMRNNNKTTKFNQLGPWIPLIEQNQKILQSTALNQNDPIYPLRTHRTIKLPKIGCMDSTALSKKLGVKMSKQSLELTTKQQETSRPKDPGMTGSVLHFYRRRYADSKTPRLASMSLDLGPKDLERKLSTIQIGQPLDKKQRKSINKKPYFNQQTARKRGLCQIIKEINSNQAIKKLYLLSRYYR